jgi:cytochrome P450
MQERLAKRSFSERKDPPTGRESALRARSRVPVCFGSAMFEDVRVGDPEHWADGPPHELFAELRADCPVHWSDGMSEYPDEAGFWSVTRAEDIRAVSLDWRTYSSYAGGVLITDHVYPVEMQRGEFIAMDPPRHDRIKALFQAGFTPKRIAHFVNQLKTLPVRLGTPAS